MREAARLLQGVVQSWVIRQVRLTHGNGVVTAFLTWFNALPKNLLTAPGVPWNNSGTVTVS